MKRITILLSTLTLSFLSINAQRIEQSIAGEWQTKLGLCKLPGTTDENKLGDGKHPTDVTTQLTRLFPYTGALDYERTITISKEMSKKQMSLYIERTKPSTLWIDGDSIGSICQLYAPHVYKLPALSQGEHKIRLRIDNRPESVPSGIHGSHAWTDATQTNWNGMLGKMAIIGTDKTYIKSVNVYPIVGRRFANVFVQVYSDKEKSATLYYDCVFNEKNKVQLKAGLNNIKFQIELGKYGDIIHQWSEYHPYLYNIKVSLKCGGSKDERTIKFGVRDFKTVETQFAINGHKTFLRGTHDACVFPINAYSPTNVEEWKALFLKAKEYGINHYRFHSYTPTEAAFEAADEVGMYLQTELPLWGTIDSTTVEQNKFLLNEARTAIDFLGNHPSFMSLGLGNELWGDFDLMHQWLDSFRKQDNRHMYVYGSNNTLGWQGAHDGEDYFVTCRVGGGEHYKTNTRTSFSFADEEDGGILNHVRPNTRNDFSYPVAICHRPIVAHETCQFQMYPDYEQIKNYTGILYPYNLEIFRDRLNENGLSSQAKDFTRVTNEWALECYKADIEYCVRTKGFGGYQLLDLKDYPGQGSALCGILDVFMHRKTQSDQKVINVMQPIVPMLLMDKFCWERGEKFKADIAICNYTEEDWKQPLEISIDLGFTTINKSISTPIHIGEVKVVGTIEDDDITMFNGIDAVVRNINLRTGKYHNDYKIWVYDVKTADSQKIGYNRNKVLNNVVLADSLNKATIKALEEGKTVILTPSFPSIEKQSIGGLFTPDYWNYAMFKTISENNNRPVSPGSLGMLIDNQHPLFKSFPTDDHTDWQWWCIAKNSRPLILNSLPKDYRPVIQTVDNIERNHKLGIFMEFRVSNGKIIIATTDFDAISDYPEGIAYKNAILKYAKSYNFNPTKAITIEQLHTLLYSETKVRDIQGVKNITDYKNE